MHDFLPEFLQRCIWVPIRALFRHYIHFQVEGLSHLRALDATGEGVLFVSNHLSEVDPAYIPAALPFFSRYLPMHYVSLTREHYSHLRGWGVFAGGLLFKAWGAYPALLGVKNFDVALAYHIGFLKHGKSLCIFPEGGICRGGTTDQARPGVSHLAWRTSAAIVPVRLVQSGPFSWHDFFHKKLQITVVFGTPLRFSDLAIDCVGTQENYSVLEHKLIAAHIMDYVHTLSPHHA